VHHTTTSSAPEAAPATTGRTIRRWARFYDLVVKLLMLGRESAVRNTTIELAQVVPGERVLDVGCGTGTLTIAAKAKVGPTGDVHGIDASPEMIDVAKRKAAQKRVDARFQVGLIEELPFPDDQFDLVLSSFMLHHLPGDLKRRGFAEIDRVLKLGGRFLAVDLGEMRELPAMMEATGFAEVELGKTKYRIISFLKGKAKKNDLRKVEHGS